MARSSRTLLNKRPSRQAAIEAGVGSIGRYAVRHPAPRTETQLAFATHQRPVRTRPLPDYSRAPIKSAAEGCAADGVFGPTPELRSAGMGTFERFDSAAAVQHTGVLLLLRWRRRHLDQNVSNRRSWRSGTGADGVKHAGRIRSANGNGVLLRSPGPHSWIKRGPFIGTGGHADPQGPSIGTNAQPRRRTATNGLRRSVGVPTTGPAPPGHGQCCGARPAAGRPGCHHADHLGGVSQDQCVTATPVRFRRR
jgi:hypothetical protein